MRYYDVSVPVSTGLPVYEGDPGVQIELVAAMARGGIADVRSLSMGVHTGTHMDAPAHFIPGGASIDALDLSICIGPAQVVDLGNSDQALIQRADLEARLAPGVERLLLRTPNSALWRQPGFKPGFVALDESAAALLVERGVRLAGIDYLSIAPSGAPAPVHRILLRAGIAILEGLDLSGVPEGRFTLVCLPLRLAGAEAAPARAILLAEDEVTPP